MVDKVHSMNDIQSQIDMEDELIGVLQRKLREEKR